MTDRPMKKYYVQDLITDTTSRGISISGILNDLSKQPWHDGSYSKQSWGNWLHHMAPYAGRITPSFAHWLIRICTEMDDLVLDPFCGIGTIPLEANLLERQSIGLDLNPYAYIVARAKMDRKSMEEQIDWLNAVRLDTHEVDLGVVPEWVREYYNADTLKEILALTVLLEKEGRKFLLGCLLGIAQGHRVGHLSKHSALTLPFKPRPDDPGEYRAVLPRMIAKVKRTYRNGIPAYPCGRVELADARDMPLEDTSVDVIISSPPYYDTVDYVSSNRLRLALIGYHNDEAQGLRKTLIQNYENYLAEMKKACTEMRRVLKPGGRCILVLGDSYKRHEPINTARNVCEILECIGMKVHGITEDQIPFNKSVQRTPRSKQDHPTQRVDRIVLATNDA